MSKFKFWYKTEVRADSLEKAIQLEKKKKPMLSSIEKDESEHQERTPLIGFSISTESDYEDF